VDGVHAGGGSKGLAELIDKYGECILADFQSEYGVNLVEEIRAGMSPAQIISLIRQLPMESRTIAQLRGGDDFRGWGIDRYMLAQLLDAVQGTTYAVVASNSKKKPKAPKPVYRPAKGGFKANNVFRQKLDAQKKVRGG
jgi:hypothetical protein